MSEAIKPTRGPWELWGDADPSQVISSPAGFVAQTLGGNDQANAQLIAEAGTVAHTTGFTPRQLVEQRDALVERVKELEEVVADYLEAQDALDNNEYLGINAPPFDEVMRHRNAASADLRAALSKSLPNTVAEVKE